MFVTAIEVTAFTYGFIFWQVHATMGTLDHVLDLLFRSLVCSLFFCPGIANQHNHDPDGEGNKDDA